MYIVAIKADQICLRGVMATTVLLVDFWCRLSQTVIFHYTLYNCLLSALHAPCIGESRK